MTIFTHPQISIAMVTPDRFILGNRRDPNDPEAYLGDVCEGHIGPGSLSIKTTGAFMAGQWSSEAPVYNQVQLQHELNVLGWEWGSFAVLIGGQKTVRYDIERNDRFIASLVKCELEFWERVQNLDAPPADASESATRALFSMHPMDNGKAVNLPAKFFDLKDRQLQLETDKKLIEIEVNQIKNTVRQEIGDNTSGVLSDGSGWSWKHQDSKAYTKEVEEKTIRVLRSVKAKEAK